MAVHVYRLTVDTLRDASLAAKTVDHAVTIIDDADHAVLVVDPRGNVVVRQQEQWEAGGA